MKKFILMLVGLMLIIPATYFAFAQEAKPLAKKTSAQKAPMPLDKTLGESQFFCGYCHTLTYPTVMKKAHKTWKDDEKHNKIGCVECHYPPDLPAIAKHMKIPKAKTEADKKKKTDWDLMKTELEVFSKLVTVLNMGESTVLRKPKIDDRSCTTSDCHPTTGKKKEAEYWTKKLKFTEYTKEDKDKTKVVISFTHKEHYDEKKWVEGQEMHCATCHKKETGKKHFEVSKESCFLCHFKSEKAKFAEERAKCSLCHKIPETPFKKAEKPEEKPFTHKDLEERKISCAGCHLEIVKGKGEIKEEKCLDCHDNTKELWKEAKNKKIMHKEHVAKQTATCFNCHEPIVHKKTEKPDKKDMFMYIEASLQNCKACHTEPHRYQTLLIAGKGGKGVDKDYPIAHHDMKTNCLACHTKEAHDAKGRRVRTAEVKSCVDCHDDKEMEKQSNKWKRDVAEELQAAREMEKEVVAAIEEAKGKLPASTLKKVVALLKDAQENLRIVDAGGGVHNKKYAVLLIETGLQKFESIKEAITAGNK